MPAAEDVTDLARAWLGKARDDLAVAELIEASGRDLGWAAAFHCQRCVEKCIKARLVLAGIEPPNTHSFAVLAKVAAGLNLPFTVDYQRL